MEVAGPEAVALEVAGSERMMLMKKVSLIMVLVLLLTGCTVKEKANNNHGEKLIVYTSFYPMYFLTDEIGKDNIELRMVIPTGVEAHDYEPSMKQLKEIEKADLFIYNGAGFESWADKLLETILDEKQTINASEEIELIKVDKVADPHIWLNPIYMNTIGERIKEELINLDGEHKEEYEENYQQLSDKLKKLDKEYLKTLEDKKRNTILVSHAAFAYMAERYEFDQIAVMGINPEQEPSPKTIADIIEIAKEEDFQYIFLETLANPKTVEVIAKESGLETLTLNPIEGLTEDEENKGEDYISIMERNLKNLKKALVD